MTPVFRLKNGDLSAYSFACGYVQRNGDNTLTKEGCYHVHTAAGEWLTFATLTEARKAFARAVKQANK